MKEDKDIVEMPQIPEGVEPPKVKYRFQIRSKDIAKYGASEDCSGCLHQELELPQRPHTEDCRDRFAHKLMEDGDPRILTEIDRTIAQRELAEQLAASRAEQILPEGAEDVAVEMDIVEPEDNGALDIGSLCRLVAEDWRRDRLEELNKVTVNKHKTWSDGVNEMNRAMKKEEIEGTIMEIYSPERTNAIAKMWGLLPGWSLHLTTADPDDDRPWDFNTQEKRDKAEQIIEDKKVMLLT